MKQSKKQLNYNHRTRTAGLALVTRVATTSRKSLYFIATVFVAVAYFAHIFLPSTEPEVKEARNKIYAVEDKIASLNSELLDLSENLANESIDVSVFRQEYKRISFEISELESKEASLSDQYQTIRANAKVFGYPSRHKFIWNFGIGLLITAFAFELMISSIDYVGEKRQAKKFASLTAGTAAGYYMAWVFYPDNDLPLIVYFSVLFVIGLLSSFTAYWILQIRRSALMALKDKVQYLMQVIEINAPKHVIDKDKWEEDIVEPAYDKIDE